jgi:hypothetical protein
MKHLESIALKDMDHVTEAKIRATAMLEVMDGILRSPFPIPRAMTVTKPIPRAHLRVMWDHNQHGQADRLVRTDRAFTLVASGNIPVSLLQRAEIPFNIVLLWYTLAPRGAVSQKESKQSGDAIGQNRSSYQRFLNPPPVATSLPSSGAFLMRIPSHAALEEGTYDIEFRLGCRDLRGGEWEIPLFVQPQSFSVKIKHR